MAVYKWKAQDEQIDKAASTEKKQVAAYCRVSTTEQESSYEEQCRHYMNYVQAQPDWELLGIYADEGVSGTGTRKRREFNRLIRDCEAGLIDIVITKSISRFARNTVDTLVTIRRLRDLNVRVIFEKENVDSSDEADEFMLTFWASFAQAESISIAKNVSRSLRTRMARGEGRVNCSRSIGYLKDPDGTMHIVPEEAKIIRRIYREYLEGASTKAIAQGLEQDGCPTCLGGDTWYPSTISSILENEKNMGDLLFQKTYTIDTLTHRTELNLGKLPRYYVSEHHDPIVPAEIFYRAQGERYYRKSLHRSTDMYIYGKEDALKNRIFCGICGKALKEVIYPDGSRDFRCCNRAYKRKTHTRENAVVCKCRKVPENQIRNAIMLAFRMLPDYADTLRLIEAQPKPVYIQALDEKIAALSHAPVTEEIYRKRILLYSQRANYSRQGAQIMTLRKLAERLSVKYTTDVLSLSEIPSVIHAQPDSTTHGLAHAGEDLEAFWYATDYYPPDFLKAILESAAQANNLRIENTQSDCSKTDDAQIDNAAINRFIDSVIIHRQMMEICFKGELTIRLDI